jgi:predicted nucleic acid-binding protein
MTLIRTIAILDANVLYPAPVRDILLNFADAKLFQPKWTKTIQEEWTSNLLANRPDITKEAIARTVKAMNIAFPDAEVNRYISIINDLKLPDPDDRHVLAAAIRAEATHIVTSNTKDFPRKYIATYGLQVSHPDNFVKDLIQTDFVTARLAFETMVSRLKKPPLSREDVLTMLERCGLPSSAKLLT